MQTSATWNVHKTSHLRAVIAGESWQNWK